VHLRGVAVVPAEGCARGPGGPGRRLRGVGRPPNASLSPPPPAATVPTVPTTGPPVRRPTPAAAAALGHSGARAPCDPRDGTDRPHPSSGAQRRAEGEGNVSARGVGATSKTWRESVQPFIRFASPLRSHKKKVARSSVRFGAFPRGPGTQIIPVLMVARYSIAVLSPIGRQRHY